MKNHIRTVKKKIAKNIGLLYRNKQLLNTSSLKSIYHSYIHTYLNYANIAWEITHKKIFATACFWLIFIDLINIKQKHAAGKIFNEDRLYHLRLPLRNLNVLNIYELKIYQNLNFMHR